MAQSKKNPGAREKSTASVTTVRLSYELGKSLQEISPRGMRDGTISYSHRELFSPCDAAEGSRENPKREK